MNKLILFNEPVKSVRKSQQRFIHELQWSDCSCSRVENSLIQMIRLERVFFSELNSQVKNREISWARATDAVKSKLLMSNFRINYCNWK